MARLIIILYIAISPLTLFCNEVKMLQSTPSSKVTPEGWVRNMLELQQNNFTWILKDKVYPFTQGGWGSQPFIRTINGNSEPFWVPYEQTAYYYDGLTRCGYLLNSEKLIKLAQRIISSTIKSSSYNGVILSEISKGEMRRWPHAVFFRAMMEEYDNTHNSSILNALIKHYKNDTITYVGRDLCNIEILYWIYSNTNDDFFKNKCIDLLKAKFSDNETLEDYIKNLASDTPTEIHAVTFHEMLKIPIILYSLTGNPEYIEAARKAYSKIDKFNMLPDGVSSGEEGLSNNNSTNCHEMCNVIDYMWSTIYMLRGTKEISYADRIENALFNAGLGGITKKFDAHQYYSAPNQIVCDNHSSNISVYDDSRMAYRQAHRPQCCTGNLNRMLPIYAESEWMKGNDNSIYKMLYGPGKVNIKSNGKDFTISERSSYPFGDTIKLFIEKGNGILNINLRIPTWANAPEAYINNDKINNVKAGKYISIQNHNFNTNDSIILVFKKKASYQRWNNDAMALFYGPLLMALSVESNTSCDSIYTPKLQSNKYMGYTMTPASDWNYILGIKDENDNNMKISELSINWDSNPWTMINSPISILIPAFKTESWNLQYKKSDNNYYAITPHIPSRGSMIYALNGLKPTAISLIPFGRTTLRISMFPFWSTGNIPPEVLATDNK